MIFGKNSKILSRIVLVLCVSFVCVLTSCNYKVPDTKVYIIGVGINYQNLGVLSLDETPTKDVTEFCMYYKYILDAKDIPNETFLMLDCNDQENKSVDIVNRDSPYVPTKKNFLALIDNLSNGTNGYDKVREQDLVVFIYSGHGNSVGANKSGLANVKGNGAFCFLSQNSKGLDTLNHDDFRDVLSKLSCPVFAIIDSCFSGHLISAINKGYIGENTGGDNIKDYGGIANYVASFQTLVAVPNITAIVASTASQLSWQLERMSFDGEMHGLFIGNILNDLGYKHDRDTEFNYYIPPYMGALDHNMDEKMNIHSPLKQPYRVYGIAPSVSEVRDKIITSEDLYNKGRTYYINTINRDETSSEVEQRSLMSIGPCNVLVAW